ncbi:MAG TPA: hypothetical protein PKO06_20505, partial [Candidatus Ozemobacteraceae bacterium]|nr:hypothetical protein [Candidatus Ozemobacteraceae bacterium]
GGAPITWMDVAELPAEVSSRAVRPILLAFRYHQAPYEHQVQIQAKWHRDYALLNATAHRMTVSTLLESDGNSFTSMELQLKANGKQFLEVTLPDGVDLESAGLDGAPTTPTMKTKSTRLISLTGSKAVRDPSQPRSVNLVFRDKRESLKNAQRVPLSLPFLDIPISSVQWTLYGPEHYVFLPLPSRMMPVPRPVRLEFFNFCLAMAPLFIGALIFGILAYKLWFFVKSVHAAATAGEAQPWTWGGVLRVVVPVLIFMAVLASVSGPMIGSITDQKVHHTFGALQNRLDRNEDARQVAPSSPPSESEVYDALSEKKRDYAGKPGMVMSDEGGALATPMPKDKVGGKAQVSFRVRSARDAGALPVEIAIPTTANSITMQRDLVLALETIDMRVIVLWKPLEGLLTLLLGFTGLAVFLLLAFLALSNRFIPAFLLFGFYLLSSLILEQYWSQSQWPGQAIMLLALCVLTAGRLLFALRSGKAVSVAVLMLACGLVSPVWAAELDPRVEQVIDVYVPFKQLEERLPKDSSLVFLKLEEYTYLRDLG